MELEIRKAKLSDALAIYNLRTDKRISEHSHNKKNIPLEDHMAWFEKKLNDPDCYIFVSESESQLVGVTRFDLKNQSDTTIYVVSIYVNPDFWGKGFGKKLLLNCENALLKECFKQNSGQNKDQKEIPLVLEAEVYKSNVGSMKLFEGCQYLLYKSEKEVLTYHKTLVPSHKMK